jgi:hypothetical protein
MKKSDGSPANLPFLSPPAGAQKNLLSDIPKADHDLPKTYICQKGIIIKDGFRKTQ